MSGSAALALAANGKITATKSASAIDLINFFVIFKIPVLYK